MPLKLILYTLTLLFTTNLLGQSKLKGIVTDSKGIPLPFVNILINDSQKDGVATDIKGSFVIHHPHEIKQLVFSYLGYEKLILKAPLPKKITVKLTATSYEFQEVLIRAGENPAHRIIKNAVANRAKNNPEKMDSYECTTYNKMAIGYALQSEALDTFFNQKDTSDIKMQQRYEKLKNFHQTFEQQELMLVESVTKRRFRKPHDLQEEVILNRIAGSKKLPMVAIATQTQPFSFYKEEIVVLEQAFLNPISKNSTSKYFFTITDTLYQQQDTVFLLSFHPRKGKNFEGLKGVLYINTKQWAIQNVIAKPTKDHLIQFQITQKYQWVNNQQWFPEQLHFELETNPFPQAFTGIKSYGRTYVSEVIIHPDLNKKRFQAGEEIVIQEEAYSRADSLWSRYQKEDLSPKEKRTYQVIDSIGEKYNIDKWVDFLEMLSKNRFDLGIVDYNLENAIKFNNYEGVRLGVGLTTNHTLSKHIEFGGYYAYGFKDKAWKYGGNATLFLDKNRDNRIDFIYKKDLAAPGNMEFIQRGDFLNFSQFSDFRNELLYKGLQIQTFPIKYLQFNIALSQEQQKPLYNYQFAADFPTESSTFSELQFAWRYAYNEKFIRIFGERLNESAAFPVVEFQYTKGFNNFWKGQWNYSKYLFAIDHTFRRKALGKTSYRIEAGYINHPLPFAKLFTPFGLGRGFGFVNVNQAFQTMDFYEFLSDRFVHLFFRQDFSALLFKSKKFRPGISIEHNLAIGSLQQPEIHEGIAFKTLEKGYFEGGIVLSDLLRVKYFNMAYFGLGLGVYYRYGAYQLADFKDNLAFRLKFSLSY